MLLSVFYEFVWSFSLQGEAVQMIEAGTAPKIVQSEEGATYDPMVKKSTVGIKWDQPALKIHNFIRGCDKVPGAWGCIGGEVRTERRRVNLKAYKI